VKQQAVVDGPGHEEILPVHNKMASVIEKSCSKQQNGVKMKKIADHMKYKVGAGINLHLGRWMRKKSDGIDGILVTVGLCIIALLLCVVMKEQLAQLIKAIVDSLTSRATGMLGGT